MGTPQQNMTTLPSAVVVSSSGIFTTVPISISTSIPHITTIAAGGSGTPVSFAGTTFSVPMSSVIPHTVVQTGNSSGHLQTSSGGTTVVTATLPGGVQTTNIQSLLSSGAIMKPIQAVIQHVSTPMSVNSGGGTIVTTSMGAPTPQPQTVVSANVAKPVAVMPMTSQITNMAVVTAAQASNVATTSSAASQLPDGPVLNKQRIQELVKEVDPNEQLDDDVEDILLQLADDFIENVVTSACHLAKHRKSNVLETKDVQIVLEKNWNMWIPGFGSEDIQTYKKAPTTEAHKQRMALIRKSLKKY